MCPGRRTLPAHSAGACAALETPKCRPARARRRGHRHRIPAFTEFGANSISGTENLTNHESYEVWLVLVRILH